MGLTTTFEGSLQKRCISQYLCWSYSIISPSAPEVRLYSKVLSVLYMKHQITGIAGKFSILCFDPVADIQVYVGEL